MLRPALKVSGSRISVRAGLRYSSTRQKSTKQQQQQQPAATTDEFGVPLSPTWSIHELLTSYPKPSISPKTLMHLHDLAALTPPKEDTKEFEELSIRMGEMVRLVEAVKLVDTTSVMASTTTTEPGDEEIPDGRVWEEGRGLPLTQTQVVDSSESSSPSGQDLVGHAKRSIDRFYLVDSAPPRRRSFKASD